MGVNRTLQPPLGAYLDIHRSIAVCFWCDASLNEEYAGNSVLRALLTCADGRTSTGGPTGDGVMELCSSTAYSRVCRKCGHPAENSVYCSRCTTR